MSARRLLSILPLSMVVGAVHAAPQCDAVVSPTALRMALASNNPGETVELISLESFGIDTRMRPAFQAIFAQQMAAHRNDAAQLSAGLSATISALCHSFQGVAPAAVIAKAAELPDRTERLPSGHRVADDLRSIAQAKAKTQATGVLFSELSSTQSKSADAAPTSPPTAPGTAPTDPAPAPAGGHGADLAGDGKTDAASDNDCEKLKPGVTVVTCSRTLIRDLNQSAVRESVLTAQQAFASLQDRLAHNDLDVSQEMVDKAAKDLQEVEQSALLILPNYGLYFGPAFALDSEGGFEPRAEFYAKFDSGRMFYAGLFNFLDDSIANRRASGWARGYFDVDYLSKDTVASDEPVDELDLFGRDNGKFQFNAGLQLHPFAQLGDWIGFEGGVGMTVPQEDGDAERATGERAGRTRWYAGLHSQTTYRFGIGELFLGIADDRFYHVPCRNNLTAPACGDFSNRYLAEGQFTLADNAATDWSVIGKVTADLPRDHSGDSDVIISILLRRDLDGYLAGFGKASK